MFLKDKRLISPHFYTIKTIQTVVLKIKNMLDFFIYYNFLNDKKGI